MLDSDGTELLDDLVDPEVGGILELNVRVGDDGAVYEESLLACISVEL